LYYSIIAILTWVSWTATLLALTSEKPTLTFEVSIKQDSELPRTLTQAFRRIFHEEGFEFKTVNLPARRGLQELKTGRVDGSMGRIGNLATLLPTDTLIRIDTPVAVVHFSRWCRSGIKKLRPPYRVGTRLGTLALNMLSKHVDLKNVTLEEVGNQRGIVQMLKTGRLDCILSSDVLLEAEGIKSDDMQSFERFDFVTFEVYPWILRRYEHLKFIIESKLRSYPFPSSFQKKYLEQKPACNGKLYLLCPDGIIFKYTVDLG
jgi:hypothetical protein